MKIKEIPNRVTTYVEEHPLEIVCYASGFLGGVAAYKWRLKMGSTAYLKLTKKNRSLLDNQGKFLVYNVEGEAYLVTMMKHIPTHKA